MKKLLFTMMFVLTAVLSAWAQDVWDGSIATEFAGGSGTQDDPYLISDGAELAYLSKITNEDASQTQGKYYRLTSDIILNENVLNKDYELNGTPANLWTPIADVTYYGIGNGSFYGDFNGDGYVISGLYCYNSSSGYVYCGLFGSLGGDAVVHNVAIIDSYSKCTSYTSGLVAANLTDNAVVRCCYVDGYSYGGQYGGLLVGTPTNYMNTLIEYCYTKGVSNGGGLTGYMSSSNAMRKCYAVALGMSCVVKQVTGYKELTDLYYDSTLASISDSYATGKTTTEMQSKEFAELLGEPFVYEQGNYPGIEGLPAIGETSNNKSGYKINVGDLTNGGGSKIKFYSFYDGTSLTKSVRRAEADMTVYLQVNIASNLLLAEADLKVTNDETGISIALKKEADGIWSFTMPETSVTTTARFYKNPHAAGVWDGSVATSFAGGTGRADDPYLISNGEELAYLAQITKANPNQTSGKFYRLTDNILLNEDVLTDDFSLNGTPENGWMPIGDPDNTWDYTGNGFKGNFDGAGYCVSGLYCVHNGQIIGLFGSIESSAEIHDLSVVDSYVSGGRFTGAIAGGNNGGKIYRCYAEAYVCNADYAGVAVGHTEGTVEYCYASGRVEGSNRGGVLGWVNYGSYANCFSTVIGGGTSGSRTGTNSYYDSNINTSGGYGTAKTTAEMQSEEFTQLLGEPFVYAEGYYPYIEGLLKIGEQPIFSSAGYRLSVGKLTNGSGSALTFHTSYDDAAAGKNTRSMEAGQTVYLKLKPRRLMFLADGTLKVINDSTGLSLTLTPIAENIWSFIMPAFSVTASAGFYRDPNAPLLWDGTIAQTFAEGDGSEDDPYLISTPDELAYLSQLTNANGTLTQGKYYQLAADICLNDQMLNGNYELEGIPENVWTPIGNSSNNSFKGVFDGNNHTISGVYIPDGNDCSGLFGTIDGATVNDLSLIDTYVKGSNYTGGLVGQVAYNDSCFIKRCYVEANVTSTNSYSGVLAGYSYYYGVIENCYAAGRASASSYPAGICGQNYYSKVHNCFSAVTDVKAIGYDWNGTNTNVYHDSNLTGSTFNSGDLFRSAATVEMQTTDFAARMGAPFEYVLGNYPYIPGLLKIGENRGWTTPTDPTHGGAGGTWDGEASLVFAGGTGTEADPYIINNGSQLAYLAKLTNANCQLTAGRYYKLEADIKLNEQVLTDDFVLKGTPANIWEPIGLTYDKAFKGRFDGNNYTISGVYIPDGNDCTGLFGAIDSATVNDLSLIDTYVKGSNYTGGLVGQVAYNDSCFIKRCFVEANVTSTNSYSGVLAGYSYYYGVIENCYAAGRASASSYPAGICGQNYYSKVHNCFSAVTGAKAIGYDWNGTNTNVYHDSNLTGSTFNSGDLFRSAATVEMQTTDFAARMGTPFEYVLGNYPYIPGLLKIGENRGWTAPTDPTHGGAGGTWDGEASLVFAGGTGTETDPYIINNGSQLAYLAKLTNANCQLTAGRYYQLGADIKLNEQVLTGDFVLKGTPANIWEPIGLTYDKAFKGRFDGNHYSISGVYIPDGNDCTGLFGAIDSATVNDLSLIDTYVKGSNYTGGLVGQVAYNDSCFIKRCFVEANVTSTNSYSGVLAGYSYYYGVIENCYAAGRASASSYPAGICGQNYYSKVHNCFSAVTGAKAIGYDWYGTNTNVYHDSNLTGSTFNSGDLFRSAETTEMLSTDFAARMGEPFEYSVGYYPYIYGLHKIDKNGKTAIMTGYSLLLGTLTNGSGCSIAFYRNYTGKTGELADVVKSGEKVLLNGSTKIYAKVTVADGKLLSGNGLSVIATTGGEIAVTEITAGLYQFTMPESAVTVSAKFLFGGFCGRTDVNDGQNLIWSIDDGVLTFQQNTVTTGSLDMNSFTADGTPWHSQAGKVKAIDLGNATSIGDNAFANCISVAGIDLGATPITVGRNAFAKSTCLIVPAASYADYQTSWSEYASQLEKDKETLTMKEGQQWRTCYSRVGRTLPASLKAYIVRDIEGSQVITGNALDYIPAGQAVLIEHSDKTGITAEATTSGAPYSEENKTPVCQLTTSEANLLQWLDSPMNVSAAQGYTLYKDEFVMVSSGILPAGIAFLPAQGGSGASSLSIFATENNMTAVELPTLDAVGTDIWYTIDGKRLSGMPTQKGLYICNGRKVVIK